MISTRYPLTALLRLRRRERQQAEDDLRRLVADVDAALAAEAAAEARLSELGGAPEVRVHAPALDRERYRRAIEMRQAFDERDRRREEAAQATARLERSRGEYASARRREAALERGKVRHGERTRP